MRFSCSILDMSRYIGFLFTCLLFSYSYGAEHQQNVIAKETLTIVRGDNDYPPLEMVEGGRLTGIHIDMIRHVADQLDIELKFLSLPWARAVKLFSSGEVDAISYFGYTQEREQYSYYHEDNILSQTRWVFIALEERAHEFKFDKALSGLEKYIVGVHHGYSYGKYLDSLKHINRDAVLNDLELELMLKKKRHDLSMISYQEFLGLKERGGFKGIVALSPSISIAPQYIAFSRVSSDHERVRRLSEVFAKEFKKFKSSSAYDELLKKYDFHRYE